jgi:hypothetical protein
MGRKHNHECCKTVTAAEVSCNGNNLGVFDRIIDLIIILIVLEFLCAVVLGSDIC